MAKTEPLSFFVKLDGPSGPMWDKHCHILVLQEPLGIPDSIRWAGIGMQLKLKKENVSKGDTKPWRILLRLPKSTI